MWVTSITVGAFGIAYGISYFQLKKREFLEQQAKQEFRCGVLTSVDSRTTSTLDENSNDDGVGSVSSQLSSK